MGEKPREQDFQSLFIIL